MVLQNEPNVKQEQKLIKIIVVSTLITALLAGGFFLLHNLLPAKKSKADEHNESHTYTVSGNCDSDDNEDIFDESEDDDTIKVTGTLKVNKDFDKLKNKDLNILIDGGTLQWDGKYKLKLASKAKIFLKHGGKLACKSSGYGKDASLYISSTKVASADGNTATYSFAEVNTAGGIQASGLAPLPVKLVRFETTLDKGKVELKWATASEINNDRFEIERSNDNRTWKVVGTVKGNGNSSTLINYTYTDNPGIITGTLYYRLHQIDFDGADEYSPVSVASNTAKTKVGKVYPNPANEAIKISLNAGNFQLTILDQSGKVILTKEVDTDFETIDSKEFPSGIYFIKLENETVSENHKIVVKH